MSTIAPNPWPSASALRDELPSLDQGAPAATVAGPAAHLRVHPRCVVCALAAHHVVDDPRGTPMGLCHDCAEIWDALVPARGAMTREQLLRARHDWLVTGMCATPPGLPLQWRRARSMPKRAKRLLMERQVSAEPTCASCGAAPVTGSWLRSGSGRWVRPASLCTDCASLATSLRDRAPDPGVPPSLEQLEEKIEQLREQRSRRGCGPAPAPSGPTGRVASADEVRARARTVLLNMSLPQHLRATERRGRSPKDAKRNRAIRREDRLCRYCMSAPAETLDHIVPLALGGPDRPMNVVGCCRACNELKADRTPKQAGMVLHVPIRMITHHGYPLASGTTTHTEETA